MKVFVDTSALIAVLSENDQFHPKAMQVWRQLLTNRIPLICNNYVLVETLAILQNRFGLEAVRLFIRDLQPVLEVFWINQDLHDQAMSAMVIAGRRQLSLVDCVSFETMRVLSISRAFVFDPHFSEQGFEIVHQ